MFEAYRFVFFPWRNDITSKHIRLWGNWVVVIGSSFSFLFFKKKSCCTPSNEPPSVLPRDLAVPWLESLGLAMSGTTVTSRGEGKTGLQLNNWWANCLGKEPGTRNQCEWIKEARNKSSGSVQLKILLLYKYNWEQNWGFS